MRALLTVMAAAVALTLSGCDYNNQAQKPASCNCAATPPPVAAATPAPPPAGTDDTPPPEHHRARYHGHGGGYGMARRPSHFWRREYSELSVATYDYRSGSTSTYAGGRDAHDDHGGGDGFHPAGDGWTDFYGRRHANGAAAIVYDTSGDAHRDHPWHGYDADCPDGDAHHRRHHRDRDDP
ncbi:MAG: hypothetical protein WDN03_16490 [Rhizomicrobium sp.]